MPRYAWQQQDAVTRAEVKENLSYRFAVLHLNPALPPERLSAIREGLQEKGFTATPDAEHGEALLRVRGFKKASDLFELLHGEGLTSRKMPTEKAPLEEELNPEARDVRKWIKKNSIRAAGISYLFADAMPILSGIATKNNAEVAQGLMWATTSAGLVAFGRKNPDFQMGMMYDRMKEYLYQEGIDVDIEDKLAIERLRTKPHYWNQMINWMYENPVLFNNSLQGVGGLMQAKAGLKPGNANPLKVGAGISVTAGQWAGMLVPEKPHISRDQEDQTAITKDYLEGRGTHEGAQGKFSENPKAWLQEKPLRMTAIGPIINNVLAGIGAIWYDKNRVNEHFGTKGWWESKANLLNAAKTQLSEKSFAALEHVREKGSLSAELKDQLTHVEQDAVQATHDRINLNTGRKFIAASPVFNIIANGLYGMSSKEDRSEDLANVGYLDEMVTVAANVYAPFPEEERAVRVSKFAGFVAYQPDIHINREQVAKRIHEKIAELQHSPWVKECRSQVAENCEAYADEMAVLRGEKEAGKKKPISTTILSTKQDAPNRAPQPTVHEAALQERLQHAGALGMS